MKEKYINLFTDFGFKKAFGEEASKEHLISFLNTLLPEHHQIHELQFCNNEYQGATALDRKAIFDLNCVSATGEYFIVDLQKAKQNFFKDRSVFYATFPIQQQAQRGDWDFRLSAAYGGDGVRSLILQKQLRTTGYRVISALKITEASVDSDAGSFVTLVTTARSRAATRRPSLRSCEHRVAATPHLLQLCRRDGGAQLQSVGHLRTAAWTLTICSHMATVVA